MIYLDQQYRQVFNMFTLMNSNYAMILLGASFFVYFVVKNLENLNEFIYGSIRSCVTKMLALAG